MIKVEINRCFSRNDGTFGMLSIDSFPICLTLERQWQNNAKGISCIPAGSYLCKRVISPKFGRTFEVTGVPGRDAILFHAGNIDDDSHGCILLGEELSVWKADGSCSIASSKVAFLDFMARLSGIDEFELLIKEH